MSVNNDTRSSTWLTEIHRFPWPTKVKRLVHELLACVCRERRRSLGCSFLDLGSPSTLKVDRSRGSPVLYWEPYWPLHRLAFRQWESWFLICLSLWLLSRQSMALALPVVGKKERCWNFHCYHSRPGLQRPKKVCSPRFSQSNSDWHHMYYVYNKMFSDGTLLAVVSGSLTGMLILKRLTLISLR